MPEEAPASTAKTSIPAVLLFFIHYLVRAYDKGMNKAIFTEKREFLSCNMQTE
jgi:hypothetical protein